jgi:hypothetical protein
MKPQERKSRKSKRVDDRRPTKGPWCIAAIEYRGDVKVHRIEQGTQQGGGGDVIGYVNTYANAKAVTLLPEIIAAARGVFKNWESGDLAFAVRKLNQVVDEATGG